MRQYTDRDSMPMSRQFTNALAVGAKYEVYFVIDRGRGALQYRMVATYMGWVEHGKLRDTDWSLRPEAGTQRIREQDLVACFPSTQRHSRPVRSGEK